MVIAGADTGSRLGGGEMVSAEFHGGRGAPVVLLHGLGMSWRAWSPLLPSLTGQYAVLAPTLPGHRGGPDAPTPLTVSRLADALETRLDELGLTRVHLVGNSLGGWLALELARRGRGRSVVAVSPAGAWRHAGDQLRVHSLLRTAHAVNRLPLAAGLSPALHSPHVRRAVFRQLMERGDLMDHREAVDVIRDAHACRVVPDILRAGRGVRLAALTRTDLPITVVWGRRDRVIPYRRHGRPLRSALPHANEVALPRAGHVPMHDARESLLRLVAGQVAAVEGV